MEGQNDRAKRLGEEAVGKLLLSFSIPAIIGMLVNALYNVVDRIFIGRGVSGAAIGGLYVTMPISLILMAFAMLIGIGGNTLVSIRLGQNRKEDADRIAGNAVILLAIISVVIATIGLIFLEPLLRKLGASESNLGYAMDYLRIILIGAPFQAVGFGMNNFIRGEGNPKIAMITMLIGALLNTILDPIFIFVFKMGVQGAALATIISQAVSCIWVLWYFIGGKSMLTVKREYLKLKLPIFLEIISIGFAPFSMQLAASMVTILLNTSLQKYGGDLATSSMGVIQSVAMLVLMPMFGINQGAQPIIGYNYGAENYDRVKKTLFYAIIGASSFAIIGFVATQFFPKNIIELFISDKSDLDQILGIAVPGIKTYLLALPFIGFQVASSAFFQAIGKPKHSAFLSLSRQVIVLIPALLIFPKMYGLKGIWMAGPIADIIATILTAILLFNFLKKLNLMQSNKLNNI